MSENVRTSFNQFSCSWLNPPLNWTNWGSESPEMNAVHQMSAFFSLGTRAWLMWGHLYFSVEICGSSWLQIRNHKNLEQQTNGPYPTHLLTSLTLCYTENKTRAPDCVHGAILRHPTGLFLSPLMMIMCPPAQHLSICPPLRPEHSAPPPPRASQERLLAII